MHWADIAASAGVPNWGDIATWVGSSAALIAVAFAGVAAFFSKRTFDSDLRRGVKLESAEESSQAAAVSSWVELDEVSPEEGAVLIRNGSDAPIYRVHAIVRSPSASTIARRFVYTVLPPGEKAVRIPVNTSTKASLVVALRFTDASGLRWSRSEYGRLTKLPTDVVVSGGEDFAATFREVAADSLESYGTTLSFVEVASGDDLRTRVLGERFSEGVAAIVAPHDWIGQLAAAERIRPVPLPASFLSELSTETIAALSANGVAYGIPALIDSVVLVRNTELLPHPPSTMEELLAMSEELLADGRTSKIGAISVGPHGDPFMMWPLFTAAGGALFGLDERGGWNSAEVLIDSEGSVEGFRKIAELGEKGLFELERNHAQTREEFRSRQVPFIIDMYGSVRAAQETGLKTDVSPVPAFGGRTPGTSFSLVYCFQVLARGTGAELADDLFVDYLGRSDVRTKLVSDFRASPIATMQDGPMKLVASHPMPAFAQMSEVWRVIGDSEVAVLTGGDAQRVANDAGRKIRALFLDQ